MRRRTVHKQIDSVSQLRAPESAVNNTRHLTMITYFDKQIYLWRDWIMGTFDLDVLGRIECMRCWLLLPIFAVSLCQSVLDRRRRVQCTLRAVCAGSFSAAFAKCIWPLVTLRATFVLRRILVVSRSGSAQVCASLRDVFNFTANTVYYRLQPLRPRLSFASKSNNYRPLHAVKILLVG